MSPGEGEDRATRRQRFEALAVPLTKLLYNAAFRLSRDAHAAEDLVQETFLRAYRTFDNFQPGTNAKAWLLTILYRAFASRQERALREPLSLPPETLETVAAQAPASEATGWQPELRLNPREVEAALDRLPEVFRAAVTLVDLHDFTYEQAATALGCKVGTVRSRLFRARQLLFTELVEHARRLGYVRDLPTRGGR